MDDTTQAFIQETQGVEGDIEKAEKLENECLEKVFDLSDELEQAKVNKADDKLIEDLETKLIQAKAKHQFASEEAEQILKSIDEVLRPGRNDAKTEKATHHEFPHLGPLLKSPSPVELIASENDFVVKCINNIFRQHIVFQFNIHNTLYDQSLEQVTVQMNCPGEVFQIVQYKSCPVIESNQIGTAYTLVELASGSSAVTGSLSCIMKYKLRKCDPATGQPVEAEGYPDEFTVGNVEVTVSNHIQVLKPN